MSATPVTYKLSDGLACITLAQPERRNVLSFELLGALNDALDAAAADPLTRVVLLGAEGKAFCAGMDLKKIALDNPEDAARFATLLGTTYRKLLMMPAPLLCGVDGPALGGAVGVALAADLVWVGPRARFAFPETRIGVVPALVSVIARRRISPGRLHAMALGGIGVDAADAVACGLAEYTAHESALADAEHFARQLLRDSSAEAMQRTKAFLQSQFLGELDRQIEDALREFNLAVATDACRMGLEAFREKKALNWYEAEIRGTTNG